MSKSQVIATLKAKRKMEMSNIINPNGQRMMSQQQAAEMVAVQQFQATYLGLVQVFAAEEIRRLPTKEECVLCGKEIPAIDSGWVCNSAQLLAIEAMKRLGINIVQPGAVS